MERSDIILIIPHIGVVIQDVNKINICIFNGINDLCFNTLITRSISATFIEYCNACRNVCTKSNTILSSRTNIQDSIFNQITQSITICLSDTTNKQFNHIRLQRMQTTLQSTSGTSIFSIFNSLFNLSLKELNHVVIQIAISTIFIKHLTRTNENSLIGIRDNTIAMTTPIKDGFRSRSNSTFHISLVYLEIKILSDHSSTTHLCQICQLISLMEISNDTDRKTIINRHRCHGCSQTIHDSRHILRNLRSKDYSRNQCIPILRINRSNNILRQNSIQINTQFTSINRMLEEVAFGIINFSSIILLVGHIARITIASV